MPAEITIVLLCSVIMWCAKKKHLLRKSRRWRAICFCLHLKIWSLSIAINRYIKSWCIGLLLYLIADFAREHNLLEVMPAMCNPDYTTMELIHARLVRKTTCANGCVCDYTICGDKDEEYLKQHEEYIDYEGYRRNKWGDAFHIQCIFLIISLKFIW